MRRASVQWQQRARPAERLWELRCSGKQRMCGFRRSQRKAWCSGQQWDVECRDRRRSGVRAAMRAKDEFCCSRGGESEFDRNSPSSGLSRSSGGLLLMVQGSWMGFKLVVAEI
ncbi:hypothetical protein CXB51_019980 [Gossypium anomalum]|uniref:Uncharacterized protein n=1 Tax=Gossypium anomalum TaxID=47600 RepID=A0A8J6CX35_9ROSI|nr:hypothetical protein CXB51_019980 [Gossypium anomalum]